MYQPISLTTRTRSLNLQVQTPLYDVCVIGQASAQTVGTVARYTRSTIRNAGVGPAVDACAFLLNFQSSVALAATAPLSADSLSAVSVFHAVGTGAGTIAVSGSQLDDYLLRIEIVTTGTLATAVVRYSLDDGRTFSAPVAANTTLLLRTPDGSSTGVAATFTGAAGAFVAGEVYNLAIIAPQVLASSTGSISDIMPKVTAFGDFSVILKTNSPNASPTDATNLTAFNAELVLFSAGSGYNLSTNASASGKFQRLFYNLPRRRAALPALMGADHDSTFCTAVTTGVTASDDRFAGVGAGYCCMQSITGQAQWRPAAWLAIARLLQNQNPMLTIYDWDSDYGPLSKFVLNCSSMPSNTIQDYTQRPLMYGFTYDESLSVSATQTGLLGPAGFLTLTSRSRSPDNSSAPESQFYFTRACSRTSQVSDFFEMQHGFVFDVFLRAVSDGMTKWHGKFGEKKTDGSGQFSDRGADTIEKSIVNDYLQPLVKKGWLLPIGSTNKYVDVHRDNNVVTTNTIVADLNCPAPAYVSAFQLTAGFTG